MSTPDAPPTITMLATDQLVSFQNIRAADRSITELAQPATGWNWQRQVEAFTEHLGYKPSKAERDLIASEQ